MEPVVNKPHWLSQDVWGRLLQKSGLTGGCAKCGTRVGITVFPIKPYWQGGGDELDNLQFLCRNCIIKDSNKDADYFRHSSFYFDSDHKPDKFWGAQQTECYNRILLDYNGWFTRPWSEICRRLYILGWVVGSGKTLAIPALGFALNRLILSELGKSVPRVDCVLVLCKDVATRDQTAMALARDIKAFGICGQSPEVVVAGTAPPNYSRRTNPVRYNNEIFSTAFKNHLAMSGCHIVVACIHQLWQKNGQSPKELSRILDQFPLIVIDEPHFGRDQALLIVEAARNSLCFGTTGSPIDVKGRLLQKFVLFSDYGYHDASRNDHSMKFLASPGSKEWPSVFEEIGILDADFRTGELSGKTYTTNHEGYDISVEASKTVAQAVVRRIVQCDKEESDQTLSAAKHRPENAVPSIRYPAHAMIKVATYDDGRMIEKLLTEMFESDLFLYSPARGYKAVIVHAGADDRDDQPLPPDHPWFYSRNHNGALSEQSARFLIVIGIGREGINNPYATVFGMACKCRSVVEVVQRAIGRLSRAVVEVKDGVLHVPSARLDTIHIITHKAFGNAPYFAEGASFVLNMKDRFTGLLSIDDLRANSEGMSRHEIDPDAVLPVSHKLTIAALVGRARLRNSAFTADDLLQSEWGASNPERLEAGEAWRDRVAKDPDRAMRSLHHTDILAPLTVIVKETVDCKPSVDDILQFVKQHHFQDFPEVAALVSAGNHSGLRGWEVALSQHIERFYSKRLQSHTDIDRIRKEYAYDVIRMLGVEDDARIVSRVHEAVGSAVKKLVNVPEGGIVHKNGVYDVPQYHSALTRPETRLRLLGYVRQLLIRRGYCPDLAAAFGITPDGEHL